MKKIILLLALFLLHTNTTWAETVAYHDFNNGSFGPFSAQSLWSITSSGGVGNSRAARLVVNTGGDAYKSLYAPIDSYNRSEYWVEFDVKVVGGATGGMKFVKFFGRNDSDPSDQRNNMTFGMDGYSDGKQRESAYFGDTVCVARWNGVMAGTNDACYIPVAEHTTSEIDLRGGVWNRYKLWVKRATSGTTNGQVKVWFNGELRAHWTNMPSNPSPYSSEFNKLSFGGYVHSTYESPWELWLDNIYVGTTEQGSIVEPGVCGPAHGETFETLASSNPNLCYSTPSATGFTEGETQFNWTCPGLNGGSPASCLAYKEIAPADEDGICGSVDGTYSTTEPTTEQKCLKGTLSSETEDDEAWMWMCDGIGEGTDEPCVTYKTVVTGDTGFIRASMY